MMTKWYYIVVLCCVAWSCKTTNVFENYRNETALELDSLIMFQDTVEYKLAINDKISISVDEHPDLSIGSIFGVYNSDEVYGKWVLIDVNGEATLPKIGKIPLAGLSLREAEVRIAELLLEYIKNPIVVVNVMNWQVSVLGEVIIPGNYSIEKMNNSLLDYISKAGGFDAYAKKADVRLIRGLGPDMKVYIIDMTDFYTYHKHQVNLQPGDVIYVPSSNGKKLDERASTLLPYASFISAL
ncbi:MAG: polysaccharide export protein, partial [Bacteroidales bacterium]|nr:polysaccharide export protein [Bacteroidales bacterium]